MSDDERAAVDLDKSPAPPVSPSSATSPVRCLACGAQNAGGPFCEQCRSPQGAVPTDLGIWAPAARPATYVPESYSPDDWGYAPSVPPQLIPPQSAGYVPTPPPAAGGATPPPGWAVMPTVPPQPSKPSGRSHAGRAKMVAGFAAGLVLAGAATAGIVTVSRSSPPKIIPASTGQASTTGKTGGPGATGSASSGATVATAAVTTGTTTYSGPADAWYPASGSATAGQQVLVICSVMGAVGRTPGSRSLWTATNQGWIRSDLLSGATASNAPACGGTIANPTPAAIARSAGGPYPLLTRGPSVTAQSSPYGGSAGQLPDGTFVVISCHTSGPYVSAPADVGGGEAMWDRLSDGRYVPDALVNAGNSPDSPVGPC